MIIAWRLCQRRHVGAAFDGEGARRFGGRWNHPGLPLVYLADSLALAALEMFVNLGDDGRRIRFSYFQVTIPENIRPTIWDAARLPKDWRSLPQPESAKELGTAWAKSLKSAALKIPSAVVPVGHNYVLNPRHPDYAEIIISEPRPFGFDPRMWK